MNPYALDDVMAQFLQIIEEAGFGLPEDAGELRDLLKVIRVLDQESVHPEDFLEAVRAAGAVVKMRQIIAEYGDSEERIRAVNSLALWLEERNVPLDGVRGFVEFHLRLQRLGFDEDMAHTLSEVLARARKKSDSDARVVERLLRLAKSNLQIEDETSRLEQGKEKLECELSDLDDEQERLSSVIRTLRAEVDRSRDVRDELREEAAELTEQLSALGSQCRNMEEAKAKAEQAIRTLSSRFSSLTRHTHAVWLVWRVLFGTESILDTTIWRALEQLFELRRSNCTDPERISAARNEIELLGAKVFDARLWPRSEADKKLALLRDTERKLSLLNSEIVAKTAELAELDTESARSTLDAPGAPEKPREGDPLPA
jgi:hypothetical protein